MKTKYVCHGLIGPDASFLNNKMIPWILIDYNGLSGAKNNSLLKR